MRGLLAVVLLLALPAGAYALPGDPPVALVAPDDGAAVGANPHVTFACPAFRKFETGTFTAFGDYTDYESLLATRPDVGTDGVLLDGNVVARDVMPLPDNSGPDRCTADLEEGNGGTYYWQADRLCTGCAGGHESSPVRRLEIQVPVSLGLSVQKRAFAGFPFVATLRAKGVPDGGKVTIERRSGGRWRAVTSVLILAEKGHAPLAFRRGRERLRLRAESVVGPARRVKVVRAAGWTTTGRDDGRYRGKDVKLGVAGSGRSLRRLAVTVTTFCPGPNTFVTGTAAVRKVKVAPDGRFYATAQYGKETHVELLGRLHHRRVTGSARLSIGACEGADRFSARRRSS